MAKVKLEQDWPKLQMDDVVALKTAYQKITKRANLARRNGYTQPILIEFTIPELQAMAYMVRLSSLEK